ncbi:flagellar biosynthesis anti-sigma factor FlgM [bacterium]|nr:flagellar biosynthesis anti-sigma factor FlgM [bacterium]MBU1990445.1 flagellar biosynthesis anti-sigma factor FlgM [bacterium]
MISQTNSSAIRSAYASNFGESKEAQKSEAKTSVSKQGDMSKIEKIKESLESGEYKINLQALSEKIAEELL